MGDSNKYVKNMSIAKYSFKKMENDRLTSMIIEITKRCNLNCVHCYINKPAGSKEDEAKELTTEEFKNIVDQAYDMGIIWATFTGGEPLLRKDFKELYTYMIKRGFIISIMSNATLIDEEIIELFKQYPPNKVEVSVYGISEETYEAVSRKPGTFKRFKRGLALMKEAGIKIRLKSMLLKVNYHEHDQISAFCKENTEDFYRFDGVLQMRHDESEERNREIADQRVSLNQLIDKERKDAEKVHAYEVSEERMYIKKTEEKLPEKAKLFRCAPGVSDIIIGPVGELRLCESLMLPEFMFDLRTGGIKEGRQILFDRIHGMYSSDKEYIESCGTCELFNYCSWCPAISYLEKKKFNKKIEYYCAIAHEKKRQFVQQK